MFTALLASASAILAALLQKLKPPQKYVRLFTYILIFICIVFSIFALIKEKPPVDKEKRAQPVTGSKIEIYILQEGKKEVNEFVNEKMGMTEIIGFVEIEEFCNRIKIELIVRK